MAFDPVLADRVRNLLGARTPSEEKHMFGGVCWMVDGKMCVGVVKDELMVRLNPAEVPEALKMHGTRMMDFTGKSMKGFLFISPEGLVSDHNLRHWISQALAFNPRAVRSASKPKKQ